MLSISSTVAITIKGKKADKFIEINTDTYEAH